MLFMNAFEQRTSEDKPGSYAKIRPAYHATGQVLITSVISMLIGRAVGHIAEKKQKNVY